MSDERNEASAEHGSAEEADRLIRQLYGLAIEAVESGLQNYRRMLGSLANISMNEDPEKAFREIRKTTMDLALDTNTFVRKVSSYTKTLSRALPELEYDPRSALPALIPLANAFTIVALSPRIEAIEMRILPPPADIEEALGRLEQ